MKYNQSLLQKFSRTCRANFGDDKCKINLEENSVQCDIVRVSGNVIHCNIPEYKGAHFKGGTMIVKDAEQGEYKFKIAASGQGSVEIENNLRFGFAGQRQVTLMPGCDKNFRTCCYSFKNAVNFRGEPAIPESNIIR
ncbi:phage BR0599 family protein [Rickettsiaceae bacterium]|nr:phage BR0599 family protein [Rickettsiaceae bacterium]